MIGFDLLFCNFFICNDYDSSHGWVDILVSWSLWAGAQTIVIGQSSAIL